MSTRLLRSVIAGIVVCLIIADVQMLARVAGINEWVAFILSTAIAPPSIKAGIKYVNHPSP
jgi:hypothetical protein